MKLILGLFVILLLYFSGFAQKTEAIHLLKYTQKDGLPSYNVRKILRDTKGFIWVGTQDGLSRFDGRTFLNYSKSASKKHRICGVDVREIIEDTVNNLIWALPGEIGINAISTITGEVLLTAVIPGSGVEDWNISMVSNGNLIWIGTSTGIKIYNISKNTYEGDPELPDSPVKSTDLEVRSLVKDDNENIWVCYSGYGIAIYNNKTKNIIRKITLSELNDHNKSNDIRFNNFTITKPGEILFATSQGLRKINYSGSYQIKIDNRPCYAASHLNIENIDQIGKIRSGELLIAGYNHLYKFNQSLDSYTSLEEPAKVSETNWLSAVQYIYQDYENNIWLGCQEGLAFISHSPSPFTPYNYDRKNKTILEHVRSIYPLNDGSTLVGLRNGIVTIRNLSNEYFKYDTGHLYHHIFQDRKGLIHVARPDGMFIYRNRKLFPISTVYPEFQPFSFYSINSHLIISDSLTILGTENDNGILCWNPLKKIVWKIERGANKSLLSSNIVNNIYKDSKGRIWVLSDNVINIINPDLKKGKELMPIEKESGLSYKLFFDMCQIKNDYWIASYGSGIIQLDSTFTVKRIINTANGLSNDGVYQIYNIESKSLLVTSNNGISVIDLTSFKTKNYFSENGLHANSFEEVAGTMKDGKIYAGGINGFTIIDPKYFSVNKTPPVIYIDNIQIKTKEHLIDTSNFLLRSITVPNDVLQTTVHFSSLNYANPNRTSIYYKITEQHAEWVNIGNNNSLPIIGFGPGTYHLQVQAFNEDGIPSEIKELTLIFLPKWYQTWWFKLLIAFVFIATVYALYRLRVNQLKKEQDIRTRLASDLHDDLGSTLNSIKVYTNLALMDKDRNKYLPKIKESAQEAVTGVKDMIWVLDDSKDTVEHLVGRVGQFAASLCEAKNIAYKQDISNDARGHKLERAEKRNLYMILKEAVNNACKYAEAGEVTLSFSLDKNKPQINIKDNGIGFDPTVANEGNGLKNMALRAKQIRYKLTIHSAKEKGTDIHLEKI